MQLVINTPGTFITQKDGCFRLKQKEKQFDISPLKVESIIISNQAMISSQAVVLALEHNIDIIFLDTYGDPMGQTCANGHRRLSRSIRNVVVFE